MTVRVRIRKSSVRCLRIAANMLIILGAAGIIAYSASELEILLYQHIDGAELERVLAQHPQPSVPAGLDGTPASPVEPLPAPMPTTHNDQANRAPRGLDLWDTLRAFRSHDSGVIGRIEIPHLHISALVREGTDDGTLRRGVSHIPNTALPGQRGNFAVAGHRDTVFQNLRYIATGDRIRFVTIGGTFDYTVTSLSVVAPDRVDLLQPTSEPTSTLITCFPFGYLGPAPRRFIVQARMN